MVDRAGWFVTLCFNLSVDSSGPQPSKIQDRKLQLDHIGSPLTMILFNGQHMNVTGIFQILNIGNSNSDFGMDTNEEEEEF